MNIEDSAIRERAAGQAAGMRNDADIMIQREWISLLEEMVDTLKAEVGKDQPLKGRTLWVELWSNYHASKTRAPIGQIVYQQRGKK